MSLSSVVSAMAVLFLIIAIGYLTGKLRLFPENAAQTLSKLVINVTNPCMVLHSVLNAERLLTNREVFLLTAIALGLFAVVIPLGILLPKLLRCPKQEQNVYRFFCTMRNLGFLGFPVVSALYGPNAVFYAAIFNLVMQFVTYTYGEALFRPDFSRHNLSWRSFCTPMIVASLLAYVLYFVDFRAPEIVVSVIGSLSGVTSPLAMLVIGITLAKVPLRRVFTNWRLYVHEVIRLLVLPLAFWALLRGFVSNQLMLGITVVMCGMPAGTITTLFAARYRVHEELSASAVFLSTLLSLVTIPLLMWTLFT